MLKLMKNEYKKIFYRKYVYVILILAILGSIGISFLMSRDYDTYYEDEWVTDIQEVLDECKNNAKGGNDLYTYVSTKQYQTYIDMGYEKFEDVPDWIAEALTLAYDDVYIYGAAEDYGLSIDEVNKQYGLRYIADYDEDGIDELKKEAEKLIEVVKTKDFKEYCKSVIDCVDRMKDDPVINDTYSRLCEFYRYCLDKEINPDDKQYMNCLIAYFEVKTSYDNMVKEKESGVKVDEKELLNYEALMKLYKYMVENKVSDAILDGGEAGSLFDGERTMTVGDNTFIRNITSSGIMTAFAVIFIIIIAAGVIANEFSQGTIKFLLINPVKRSKIFFSKYLTCLTLLVAVLAVFFGIHVAFTFITSGTAGSDALYLEYVNGNVEATSIMSYAFKQYLIASLSAFTSMTLAIAISSFARNSAVAIAFSLAVQFVGDTVVEILSNFRLDWGKYLIFSNTDHLPDIAANRAPFPSQSMSFAVTTIVIYMVVFLLTAYDGFTRKEV